MARKAKRKVPQIVQSAVRVTLTLDFPVTEGQEVNDIKKLLNDQDVYELIGNYFYKDVKTKTEIVTLTSDVPPVVQA